jgi:hypothetical protein
MLTTSKPTASDAIGSFISSVTVVPPRRVSRTKPVVFAAMDKMVTGHDLVDAFLQCHPSYASDRARLLARYTQNVRLNVNGKLWALATAS